MKVLRGTLTFVLGLVLGIILFLVAVVGTIAGLGTLRTVGEVQSAVTNKEIISSDSELYGETLLKAIQEAIKDYQNFNTLSMKTLYERYGIKFFKGVSGLDFTSKEFYSTPLTDIIGDLSLLLNDFYLSDVEKVAGLDFESYNLPILTENLDVGISKALDNILGSLNGDLSIRSIKDKFGIDLGVADNDMLAALQDINLSSFGSVIDALTINTLLKADTDTFILRGENQVYTKTQPADEYEVVTAAEIANKDYVAPTGVETYIAGGYDDGTLDVRELRFYRYSDGRVVVNNSCYNDGWTKPEDVEVVRHRLYSEFKGNSAENGEYYIIGYANRIASFAGNEYTLVEKGFIPLADVLSRSVEDEAVSVYKNNVRGGKVDIQSCVYKETVEEGEESSEVIKDSEMYAMTDEELTKDSSLGVVEEPKDKTYLRMHLGTSTPVLQKINWLSIGELRNADSLLNSLRIGDIVTYTEDTAPILVALKDSTLNSVGEDINNLKIGDILKLDDDSAPIMKALANRECTLEQLDEIANVLTLGELLEIHFDEYEEDADGAYVRSEIYANYDQYVANEIYGYGAGDALPRYHLNGGVYEEAPDGEFVKTFYYTLYDQKRDGDDVTRYNLTQAGDTALALQSLARRACKMGDMGSALDDLTVAELLRIEPTSAHLFKSLAKRGSKMSTLADEANDLEIGEMIEITPESSKLMRSLDARHCTLNDMSTITDKLTLQEMLEITYDNYVQNEEGAGMYVQVLNPESYVPYDEAHDTWPERDKYTYNKESDSFDLYDGDLPADVSLFVQASYFTLYNPAVHTDESDNICKDADGKVTRYDKQAVEGASSSIIQRFAGATMNSFSTAFDELMLSEVMEINGDQFGKVLPSAINLDESGKYYYGESVASGITLYKYDEVNAVYTVATQDDLKNYKDNSGEGDVKALFKVDVAGSSISILKKLAYVKVSKLSDAMEIVMKEMLLSEIIDIYTYDAIATLSDYTVGKGGEANIDDYKDGHYFIEWDGQTTINDKPVAYVYETGGKYFANNFRYRKLDPENEADQTVLGEGTTIYYKYTQFKSPVNFSIGNRDNIESDIEWLYSGNAYVKMDDGIYSHNLALASYYLLAQQDASKLYYREKVSSEGEIGDNGGSGTVYESATEKNITVEIMGTKKAPAKSLDLSGILSGLASGSVDLSSLEYQTTYDPTNPAHCDMDLYLREEGAEGQYIVPVSDPDYGYKDNITLMAQYCRDVMVRVTGNIEEVKLQATENAYDTTLYVYTGSGYVSYDEDTPGHNLESTAYYIKKCGYVAQYAEVFTENPDDVHCTTNLDFKIIGELEREHSSKVLCLLADKTINDMNSAISEATIADFMDVTPGTIFDDKKISGATLNNLGIVLTDVLSGVTIDQLLTWANISSIQPAVREALKGVTLSKFFSSLEYANGAIQINMSKLFL